MLDNDAHAYWGVREAVTDTNLINPERTSRTPV
jgi:hypothetical protein